MKKSEHVAALKAAQEELARLQAITPEDDVPLGRKQLYTLHNSSLEQLPSKVSYV